MEELPFDKKTALLEMISDLKEKQTKINEAAAEFKRAAEEKYQELEDLVREYNKQTDAFETWRDGAASEVEEYISNKSEEWRDSDVGEQYADWQDMLENCAVDELDLEESGVDPDIEALDAQMTDIIAELERVPLKLDDVE